MELIHRAAGDRLLLMLIPDVFQVDDDLWVNSFEEGPTLRS